MPALAAAFAAHVRVAAAVVVAVLAAAWSKLVAFVGLGAPVALARCLGLAASPFAGRSCVGY